jgi:beta-barrel assembly-enhancing protease
MLNVLVVTLLFGIAATLPAQSVPGLDAERRLGQQFSREFEQNVTLNTDPLVTALVTRVAQTLAKVSDAKLPVIVRVVENDTANVYTLPGGHVYVTTGLIGVTKTEAEFAFALAHGIGSVAARHPVEKDMMHLFLGVPLLPLKPQFTPSSTAAHLAIFSRETVEEADFLGIQYLQKAGYDPNAAVSLLQSFQARSSASPPRDNVLQSHPPLSARIKKIEANIQQFLPPSQKPLITSSEFEEVRAGLTFN